jgi:hypothetical protein
MKYCKCSECNYPQHHLTKYHRCGKCQQFGHGQVECDDRQMKIDLWPKVTDPESIDSTSYCTKPLCEQKHTHTLGSHHDAYDARYRSSLSVEDLQWLTDRLHPSCHKEVNPNSFITDYYYQAVKKLLSYNRSGKAFVEIGAGMGCNIYAKHDNNNSPIHVVMIEYGFGDINPDVTRFINGYQSLNGY